MKRLMIIGFTGCALALAPTMSASAMPAATPHMLGSADGQSFRSKAGMDTGMGMGGASTAVAATTTVGTEAITMVGTGAITMVGTGAITMVGGIIAIGDDFHL